MISVGNASCSWGVEFADDPRNPTWRQVLADCAAVGYMGIELGPIGFMPEDPALLAEGLAENGLTLIGGVVFRPFHDSTAVDDVVDATARTCRALVAHSAQHLVLIDSISPRPAPAAGRGAEAEQMGSDEWRGFVARIRNAAQMGADHGLTVSIHTHAAGFIDFEPELVRLLGDVDETLLKIRLDTGHHSYAGYDPVAFLERHAKRISYMNFKDINPKVKARAIATRTGFDDACAQGIFCNRGLGDVDFPGVRAALLNNGFTGWCTVEQDCDPAAATPVVENARANRAYLSSIGF